MDIKSQPFDYMQYMYSFVQNPIIRGCIRFNGKLQGSKLRHAIEKLALTYPILLCKYKVQKGTWVTDPHASCENLLTTMSAKNDFSTLEIDSLLTSLKIGIDLPLKIYWICGEEKDSLCIIASHLLCDGRGFEQLLYLLAELYSGTEIKEQINRDRSFSQIDEKLLVFQGVSISDAFIATADKSVPYFQLAASTYKDKCTLSVCTYAFEKSFDLLCSVVDKICSVLENL